MKTLRSPASGTFVVAGTLVNSTAFHFRTYTGPSCASAGIRRRTEHVAELGRVDEEGRLVGLHGF